MNTRKEILENIKEVNKEAFHELALVSEEEISDVELQEIYDVLSGEDNIYSNMGGDGINDVYMGEGIYVRPDGSTYCDS